MNTKKLFIFVFVLQITLFTFNGFCAGPGTTGARVLNQGIGVRPLGMGEAYTAVADDINAIYFNPAGLTLLNKREIGVLYMSDVTDAFYSSVGFVQPFEKIGVLGISFILYSGGIIEINNLDGTSADKRAQDDYVVTISYARNVIKNLSAGANIKVLRSTLVEQYTAYSYAADIGVLYNLGNLNMGISVQNIGTPIIYKEKPDPLPLKIKVGAAYKMKVDGDNSLTMAFDVNKPYDNIFQENIGVEYWFKNIFAVRSGYKFGYDSSSFTLGGGFVWKFMQIDFTWGLRGDLGNTLQCSLIIR